MSRKPPPWPLVAVAVIVFLAVLLARWRGWIFPSPPPSSPEVVESVPPSITVMEESIPSGIGGGGSPGMRDLAGYAAPGGTDLEDMRMLARCVSAFLTIHKQAGERPLSANGEWSAALRGQRPGTTRWLDEGPPVFSADGKIIDRHGTPVHFHALGHKAWEFRSAGPDKILFTDDDALGSIGEDRR